MAPFEIAQRVPPERGPTPALLEDLFWRENAEQIRLFEMPPEVGDPHAFCRQCLETLEVVRRLDELHAARLEVDYIYRVKHRKETQAAARGWLLLLCMAAVTLLLIHGALTGEVSFEDLQRVVPKL